MGCPFSRDAFSIHSIACHPSMLFIDMARMLDHVIGNGVATVVVAAWNRSRRRHRVVARTDPIDGMARALDEF